MLLKLYAASTAVVWKTEDGGADHIHRASYVFVLNEQEARTEAMQDILQDCPEELGFVNHSVNVIEVPGITKEVKDGEAFDAPA